MRRPAMRRRPGFTVALLHVAGHAKNDPLDPAAPALREPCPSRPKMVQALDEKVGGKAPPAPRIQTRAFRNRADLAVYRRPSNAACPARRMRAHHRSGGPGAAMTMRRAGSLHPAPKGRNRQVAATVRAVASRQRACWRRAASAHRLASFGEALRNKAAPMPKVIGAAS